MKIKDSTGRPIQTLDEWSTIYEKSGEKRHWKPGRSAHSIADFILNHNGAERLRRRVEEMLGETVHFDCIVPEQEKGFDAYGRGRVHDLGITGTTMTKQSLFVGVEAKVDETFGPTIGEAYDKATKAKENNPRSNARRRIEDLLAMHFPQVDSSHDKLRYQLLYATAGTFGAGKDVSILYITVFKTQSFNEEVGKKNQDDYLRFIEKAGAQELQVTDKNVDAHELWLDAKRLICVYEYFEL